MPPQQPNRQYGAPAITGAVFPQDTYGPPGRDNGANGGYSYGNGNGNNEDYNNVSIATRVIILLVTTVDDSR